jgi:uroporphyrinogen decarboxylase
MNSHKRLFSCIDGNTVDKIPNLSILMAFAAKYSGIKYRTFILEPDAMVEANLKCHEDFGIDVVTVMSDPYGEAHDYGSMIVTIICSDWYQIIYRFCSSGYQMILLKQH